MRKVTLLVVLAFAVTAATSASAAKKKMAAPADPAVQAQRDSAAFFEDAFHPWAPTAVQPKVKGKKKKK